MKKAIVISTLILSGAVAAFGQSAADKNIEPVKQENTKNLNAAKPAAVGREKFNPKANPKDDLQTAIVRATKENKRIVLDVGGEWCGWCREMDNFLIRNIELNQLKNDNYVWLKVNFSEENENKEFLAAYPAIKGYPHLFVLDKDGKFLYSKDTSELEDGVKSYNLQKYTDFLNEYAPKKDAGN